MDMPLPKTTKWMKAAVSYAYIDTEIHVKSLGVKDIISRRTVRMCWV